MTNAFTDNVHQKILDEALPESFLSTVEDYYVPISQDLAEKALLNTPYLLGVQGCQGSGKSTIATFLKLLLEENHHKNVVVLSIDDFYFTKKEREELAAHIHPLFKTRGVPGTHDVLLALDVIRSLKKQTSEASTSIPRFDKATDDRFPRTQWDVVTGKVDVIILEGWCVGLSAQAEESLLPALNELEENDDQDGVWRRYVNHALYTAYAELFGMLDDLLVIKAPSFDCVFQWRCLQEEKLKMKLASLSDSERLHKRVMSQHEIKHFISHYQRLTEHALKTLPKKATWLLELNEQHQITQLYRS